jgi:hypothetical protein
MRGNRDATGFFWPHRGVRRNRAAETISIGEIVPAQWFHMLYQGTRARKRSHEEKPHQRTNPEEKR